MKKIFITIISICLSFTVFAQKGVSKPYSSAFGGRIEMQHSGSPTFLGFSYKHYMVSEKSIEVIALSDFGNGLEFYGLYQYNGSIPDFPPKLRWVLGGGANLGTWTNDNLVFGLTGMLRIEYSLDEIPLNLGLDWKPVLNLVTNNSNRFWPTKIGLSIRYTIK